jgi:hypothetical protein
MLRTLQELAVPIIIIIIIIIIIMKEVKILLSYIIPTPPCPEIVVNAIWPSPL